MKTLESRQRLDEILPYGMIATKKWLSSKGLSRHALDNALKSRKLEALTAGVYTHAKVPVTWQGVASSLQRMYETPVDVGGMTALELQGFGHYLSASKQRTVHLYSEAKQPNWMKRLKVRATFMWHGTKTLWLPDLMTTDQYLKQHLWQADLPPLEISCPEKASLEMLMDVPQKVSFDHADELMQGMTSLSPRKMAALLRACRNVKVKRLFFWLADRQGYAWFNKLDVRAFDLGKGKRVVFSGGKLDRKYQITVPEHLHGSN